LGSSFYSIHLLNRYVTIGLTPTLVTLTLGVVLAITFELILRSVRQKVLSEIANDWDQLASERVYKAFSQSRFEALVHTPLAVRREALGAPMVMQQLGSSTNLGSVLDLPYVFLFLISATFLYWPFGVLATVGCAVALWKGLQGEKLQRASAEEHSKASSRAQQLGQFLLTAGEALRAMPLAKPLQRRWSEIQQESLSSRRTGMNLQSTLQTSIGGVGQVLTVCVYAFGAVSVVRGDLTTGALIGANILVSRAFAVCSRAAYLADPVLRASRAQDALSKIEELPNEEGGGAEPRSLTGQLELMDVAFSYAEQPVPLFEQLNVHLAPGQVMAISGPNGSGKSSLVKLMLGLLSPRRGLVRADAIELKQLSQEWWRSHIGYAPQEAVFFDGTLRENLLLDRDISDGELIESIRELGLDNFLASDPKGLDRMMSSHESTMAVGLRRRFILLRATLGNPNVVFLDDPTEGLDQSGQLAVAKLLNQLLKSGKTLVVASNESFILKAADVIVDMSQKPVPSVVRAARTVPTAGATV
jgi:ATP-binding cassette, subfamily C, bacterial LapB